MSQWRSERELYANSILTGISDKISSEEGEPISQSYNGDLKRVLTPPGQECEPQEEYYSTVFESQKLNYQHINARVYAQNVESYETHTVDNMNINVHFAQEPDLMNFYSEVAEMPSFALIRNSSQNVPFNQQGQTHLMNVCDSTNKPQLFLSPAFEDLSNNELDHATKNNCTCPICMKMFIYFGGLLIHSVVEHDLCVDKIDIKKLLAIDNANMCMLMITSALPKYNSLPLSMISTNISTTQNINKNAHPTNHMPLRVLKVPPKKRIKFRSVINNTQEDDISFYSNESRPVENMTSNTENICPTSHESSGAQKVPNLTGTPLKKRMRLRYNMQNVLPSDISFHTNKNHPVEDVINQTQSIDNNIRPHNHGSLDDQKVPDLSGTPPKKRIKFSYNTKNVLEGNISCHTNRSSPVENVTSSTQDLNNNIFSTNHESLDAQKVPDHTGTPHKKRLKFYFNVNNAQQGNSSFHNSKSHALGNIDISCVPDDIAASGAITKENVMSCHEMDDKIPVIKAKKCKTSKNVSISPKKSASHCNNSRKHSERKKDDWIVIAVSSSVNLTLARTKTLKQHGKHEMNTCEAGEYEAHSTKSNKKCMKKKRIQAKKHNSLNKCTRTKKSLRTYKRSNESSEDGADTKFFCDICGMKLISKKSLQQHMRKHFQ